MHNLVIIVVLSMIFSSNVFAEETPVQPPQKLNLNLSEDMIHSPPKQQKHMLKKYESHKTVHHQKHVGKKHQADAYSGERIKHELSNNVSLHNGEEVGERGVFIEKKL